MIKIHDHEHDPTVYKKGESLLRNKLKRAPDSSSDRLREVFNETCRNDPCSSSVTFRQKDKKNEPFAIFQNSMIHNVYGTIDKKKICRNLISQNNNPINLHWLIYCINLNAQI